MRERGGEGGAYVCECLCRESECIAEECTESVPAPRVSPRTNSIGGADIKFQTRLFPYMWGMFLQQGEATAQSRLLNIVMDGVFFLERGRGRGWREVGCIREKRSLWPKSFSFVP